jgi:hypothetical protein
MSYKKLRADCSQGMRAVIRCRIVCVLGCYIKSKDEDIQNYNFAFCFIWVRNMVADIEGEK